MKTEECLNTMLEASGIHAKSSYAPGEVCKILSISERSFYRYIEDYEPDRDNNPTNPASLYSYTLRTNRRVPHKELLNFISRNTSYHRKNADPDQLLLWEDE
ncbi:MAG: helix-turn-helix domain-containing protein [Desulfobacterales bacterium]|nr:helix-turn-helix domain-containing protein [Desulfobacterales bacterium]